MQLAKKMNGVCIEFFNSEYGIKLRPQILVYPQLQLPGISKHCSLCISGSEGSKRRRTSYNFGVCDVHLCSRVHSGNINSCWNIWNDSNPLSSLKTFQFFVAFVKLQKLNLNVHLEYHYRFPYLN